MFLSRGVWQTIEGLQDPDLKQLVSCLPDTLLNSSTTAKYMRAFMRWKTWAQPRREVTVFPIEEVHFAFYLQHLADTTKSKATVEEAVNAISWRHQLAGQPTINTSAFVHDTVVGLQQKGSVYCTTVKAARMQVEFLSSQNNESFLSCMQLYRSMRSRGAVVHPCCSRGWSCTSVCCSASIDTDLLSVL